MQTSYPTYPSPSVAGMIADDSPVQDVITRVTAASVEVPAGRVVARDGDGTCKLPTSSSDVLLGASIYLAGRTAGTAYGAALWNGQANPEGVPILRKGRIWLETETAVTEGDAVYVRFTSHSPYTAMGKVRNTADTVSGSATCVLLAAAKFAATADAGALVPVDINIP